MALKEVQRTSGSVRPPSSASRASHWWQVDPAGLIVGALLAALSMTPSLLPRTWLFQGVVAGLTAFLGYGLGVFLLWWVRHTRWGRRLGKWLRDRLPSWVPRAAWAALLVGVLVLLVVALVAGARWQRDISRLMGLDETPAASWLLAGPLLLAVAALLLAVARTLRWLSRQVTRLLGRLHLPPGLARVVAAALVAVVTVTLLNDVLLSKSLTTADSAFASGNDITKAGVEQPASATRSGSPDSQVSWDSLGREGRSFVAVGRSADELGRVNGAQAKDPIRLFAGLETAREEQGRVDVVLAEMERTGAFTRRVVTVATTTTTTGSGWVDEKAIDSLELMHNGDTATVATQYSYLPSWLSFIVDSARVQKSGRLLFDAVHARLERMPEAERPLLLVFGESLGSRGSEAAFSSLEDLRAQVDGALWVGPPHSNRLWNALVERRDPGTPEVAPVYAGGLVVRFAGDRAQIDRPHGAPWDRPRVLYLQHPSDPIVWWSPELLLRRPDWLVEPPGDDVSPSMSWYPWSPSGR